MARELHMTVQQFLANTTAEEIAVWVELKREEMDNQRKANMIAKAASRLR